MAETYAAEEFKFREWTFVEDASGIVYCLGRNTADELYDAVAVYELMPNGEGSKLSLESDAPYKRIMYHGFPEEDEKLAKLRTEIRAGILGNMCLRDHCIYINPSGMSSADPNYRSIDLWLSSTDRRRAQYRESLERASEVIDSVGISLSDVELYGGATFGLVGKPDKQVDDIDLLLDVTSEELYESAKRLQSEYGWGDIDPVGILSDRRRILKAKRWSTSQIRLFDPTFLSIDLKIKRSSAEKSFWDGLPENYETKRFEGPLKVVDDTETFCISPALQCEDLAGDLRTVLFRGYPYIGCAVNRDKIFVRGTAIENSQFILVTQAREDLLVPDFTGVPIS